MRRDLGLFLCAIALSGCATYKADWSAPSAVVPSASVVAAAPVASEAKAEQATPVVSAEAEGDALWARRGEQASLVQALSKWEAAFQSAPSAALAAKLSRGTYLLADGYLALAGDEEGRDAGYQKGLDWATEALKLAAPAFAQARAAGRPHAEAVSLAGPESIDALYWFASNLGKWANSKGFATRLRYKDDIKATMLRVQAIDGSFFHAAPWRYFGSFEAATSGIAGGSLVKSEENFKKAVEMGPHYLGTKVLWADYLCTKKQDRARYVELLQEVLAADPAVDPSIEPENRIEQKKARVLLDRVDDKF